MAKSKAEEVAWPCPYHQFGGSVHHCFVYLYDDWTNNTRYLLHERSMADIRERNPESRFNVTIQELREWGFYQNELYDRWTERCRADHAAWSGELYRAYFDEEAERRRLQPI